MSILNEQAQCAVLKRHRQVDIMVLFWLRQLGFDTRFRRIFSRLFFSLLASGQSELLGQFRLISDRASDVSGGRICLTQNAYAEL